MENYVKAVLYVYPRLERLEKDCEEHIRNRAFMSYDYRTTTERLSEELAEEIIRKGLTKETFFSEYARFDWLMSVYRFIEAGKEGRNAAKEHSLVEFLYGKSTGPTFRELWKKGKKRDG